MQSYAYKLAYMLCYPHCVSPSLSAMSSNAYQPSYLLGYLVLIVLLFALAGVWRAQGSSWACEHDHERLLAVPPASPLRNQFPFHSFQYELYQARGLFPLIALRLSPPRPPTCLATFVACFGASWARLRKNLIFFFGGGAICRYCQDCTEEKPLYVFDKHFAKSAPALADDYSVPGPASLISVLSQVCLGLSQVCLVLFDRPG